MALWSWENLRSRDGKVEGWLSHWIPSLVCAEPRPFPCVVVTLGQVSSGNIARGQGWYLFLAQAEHMRQHFWCWAGSYTEVRWSLCMRGFQKGSSAEGGCLMGAPGGHEQWRSLEPEQGRKGNNDCLIAWKYQQNVKSIPTPLWVFFVCFLFVFCFFAFFASQLSHSWHHCC